MVDEVYSEVKNISANKKFKYLGILIYIYIVRILIALIPATILAIIKFIIDLFVTLTSSAILGTTFDFIFSLVTSVVSLLTFCITSPFLFGGLNYFYKESMNEKTESINKYLGNHKLCFKQMRMTLELVVFTFLGLLCFIAPGVIYFTNRIMAPFILIDNEDMEVKDCFKESVRIMENRKGDFVKLLIKIMLPSLILYILSTYIGHFNAFTKVIGFILSIVTFFVFIFALADMVIACSCLYKKVMGKRAGAIDVEFREIDD